MATVLTETQTREYKEICEGLQAEVDRIKARDGNDGYLRVFKEVDEAVKRNPEFFKDGRPAGEGADWALGYMDALLMGLRLA